MSRVKLNVLGISYSQTQSGAYALVLSEEDGERRIPIIVGGFEAQAIAIQLEGLKPPRPLTHDLFHNFAKTFSVSILEVEVYKLEEGVFFSKLLCDNGKDRYVIDARTSDAIALALRFKCPIYTTQDIINRAGIIIDVKEERYEKASGEETGDEDVFEPEEPESVDLADYDETMLHEMLQKAIESEDYEKASSIRDELNRRENT
jgi:hypothetical protein